MVKIKVTGPLKEIENYKNLLSQVSSVTATNGPKKLKGNNSYYYYHLDINTKKEQ